jgi:predicted AAA+ superfamily ATPase
MQAYIYFWRDNIGTEIDVVFEEDMKLKALEIKSGKTFSAEFTSNLEARMRYSGSWPEDCALIYIKRKLLSVIMQIIIIWTWKPDHHRRSQTQKRCLMILPTNTIAGF